MLFEFLIPRRPLSVQAKKNRKKWKAFVISEAKKTWSGTSPYNSGDLHVTLVYLYDDAPVDVDNIIKPILDSLTGLIYDDDILVTDVESHRRSLTGSFEIAKYPDLLVRGILSGKECVYVKIEKSKALEDYLQ
ncbi:MAG TPA: RusA family crossover junction endodeoxyribonuclease [Chloroflexi bacterium]|nr:RusA family crossover junction endodeoxyribonuclease [Chloroflexota bacterium]